MPVWNVTLPVWGGPPVVIHAVQGESEGRTVLVTLTDADGQPVNLSGAAVRLYVKVPGRPAAFSDGSITEAATGICSFTLVSGVTAAAGIASCQILITWPDNRSLKVVGLELEITPSNLEKTVEAANEFSALVKALNKTDIAVQAAEEARQAIAEGQAAADSANTACARANTAAQSADSAACAAGKAASEVGCLYRMTDPLTGRTAYVTDIIDSLTAYIFTGSINALTMDKVSKTAQNFDMLAVDAVDFDTGARMKLGVS